MYTQLISIGNSKGIRIPATLIKEYNFKNEVEILPREGEILIRPASRKVREGWEKAFIAMHEAADDQLLVDDSLDIEAWEWK